MPCCPFARLQLAEARNQREEMLADLASLTSQASALQAEIDSRDEKMGGLEAAAEQAHSGLEAALGRLRELEGEQQQLEARVTLLQEENLELSTEVSRGMSCRGCTHTAHNTVLLLYTTEFCWLPWALISAIATHHCVRRQLFILLVNE